MKLKKLLQNFFIISLLFLILINSNSTTKIENKKQISFMDRYGFRCISETGVQTGIRVNSNNEVECWSENGKECVWGLSSDEKCNQAINKENLSKLVPLQCGVTHKLKFGTNGYDTPDHWCQKGLNFFFGKYHCPSKTGLKQTIMLDKDTGDLKCMSKDFVNCYEGKDAESVCGAVNRCKASGKGTSKARLFVEISMKNKNNNESNSTSKGPNDPKAPPVTGQVSCGDSMKEKIGHTGYQDPGDHWCKQGLVFFRFNGSWLKASETGSDTIVRLGKKGSIECLSRDGSTCLVQNGGDSAMQNDIDLLTNNGKIEPKVMACGKGIPRGKTGFENPNSWCSQAYYAVLGLSKPANNDNNNNSGDNNNSGNRGKNDNFPSVPGNNSNNPANKKSFLNKVKDKTKDLMNEIKKLGGNLLNKGKDLFNKLPPAIKEKLKSQGKAVFNAVKNKFNNLRNNKKNDIKLDPLIDIPWRRTAFGPNHNGFNGKPNINNKIWRAKNIGSDTTPNQPNPSTNPSQNVPSGQKIVKLPGWRNTDRSQIQPAVETEKTSDIGNTWRDGPYKDKDIELYNKQHHIAPPPIKDNWRDTNEMYDPDEKTRPVEKKIVREGYKGKWEPLMKPIQFYSKKGEVLGNGKRIKIAHILTRNLLHSHPIRYNTGSKQQEITCFWQRDDNDWWIIKGPAIIKHGDTITLTHMKTGKNLHSHKHLSPTSKQQEITGYGFSGKGDSNDNFRVLITQSYLWDDNKELKVGDIFKLVHVNTGVYLHSHGHKTNVSHQQEVTGIKSSDDMNNDYV